MGSLYIRAACPNHCVTRMNQALQIWVSPWVSSVLSLSGQEALESVWTSVSVRSVMSVTGIQCVSCIQSTQFVCAHSHSLSIMSLKKTGKTIVVRERLEGERDHRGGKTERGNPLEKGRGPNWEPPKKELGRRRRGLTEEARSRPRVRERTLN